VSFDADFIKGLLKEPKKTPDLRLFVGRSEWSPSQFQNEMFMKAWYGVWSGTNLIFSPSPQSLWRKLVDRAEPAPVSESSQTCLLQPRIFQVGFFQDGNVRVGLFQKARNFSKSMEAANRKRRFPVSRHLAIPVGESSGANPVHKYMSPNARRRFFRLATRSDFRSEIRTRMKAVSSPRTRRTHTAHHATSLANPRNPPC
jgi:uncharacterized protein DUF179 (AlgH-like)